VDYNKLIVWTKKILPQMNEIYEEHYLRKQNDPIVFKMISSLIKFLDISVIAKFVPAIFIDIDLKLSFRHLRNLLCEVNKTYGKIGDRKLCYLAFEEVWSDNFDLAKQIWEFSDFGINEIDNTFKVKIAGKEIRSNGLYGLFIPLNNDEKNIEIFEWKLEYFKPSYDDMVKIKRYLNDILVRCHPGYTASFVEYRLYKIISAIINPPNSISSTLMNYAKAVIN
jgi:hypothetical protein